MLQNALHQALPEAIRQLESTAVDRISQANIATHPDSIPLHLEAPGPTLIYTTAVAHAIAALGPWPPMAVAQALQTTWASQVPVEPPLPLNLVPHIKGEGWLHYTLTAADLASWLEAVYKAPLPPGSAPKQPLTLASGSSPLARKLHLSEIALLHHGYASCWRLLHQGQQAGWIHLGPLAPSSLWPVLPLAPLPLPPQPLSPDAQKVLHGLTRLVDTLAADQPQRHCGRQGLYLVEQLYGWEATTWQWHQAPQAQRHYYLGLVAASQRSLQDLLQRARLPAPASL